MKNMETVRIHVDFSVCKLHDLAHVDFSRDFVFLSKTDEETSLVCESSFVPRNAIAVETGWKAFRIAGILDFGLIGIIAKITNILAEANVSVFVVSTYNTDYVFLKAIDFEQSIALLENSGYKVT